MEQKSRNIQKQKIDHKPSIYIRIHRCGAKLSKYQKSLRHFLKLESREIKTQLETTVTFVGGTFSLSKVHIQTTHVRSFDSTNQLGRRAPDGSSVPRFVHAGVSRRRSDVVKVWQKWSKSMYFVSLKGTHTQHMHVPTSRRAHSAPTGCACSLS